MKNVQCELERASRLNRVPAHSVRPSCRPSPRLVLLLDPRSRLPAPQRGRHLPAPQRGRRLRQHRAPRPGGRRRQRRLVGRGRFASQGRPRGSAPSPASPASGRRGAGTRQGMACGLRGKESGSDLDSPEASLSARSLESTLAAACVGEGQQGARALRAETHARGLDGAYDGGRVVRLATGIRNCKAFDRFAGSCVGATYCPLLRRIIVHLRRRRRWRFARDLAWCPCLADERGVPAKRHPWRSALTPANTALELATAPHHQQLPHSHTTTSRSALL